MRLVMEYIWLDALGKFRSKTKVTKRSISPAPVIMDEFSLWDFDGSSTGQATGKNSEIYLRPVMVTPDPFRSLYKSKSYLVLCDLWLPDGTPHPDNTRESARILLEKVAEEKPWFGFEQEFFMYKANFISTVGCVWSKPLGMVTGGQQGQYYCGVGIGNCFGRDLMEDALNNMLYARLHITGLNFEVAPGQSEFQVRNEGIKAADELLMLRYILYRTAERYNVHIELDPKPEKGDWNGSGCHTNFSTKKMRADGGISEILVAIGKLKEKHEEHLAVYGKGNERRLTGKHETASMHTFSYGVADRGASIRIPRITNRNRCGYLEDRRPASNMDPYLVAAKIVETTIPVVHTELEDLGEEEDALVS